MSAWAAAYRQGFEAFKEADHDPQVGDKAVAGMDREPSQLIDQAGALIAKASGEVAARAAATAQTATTISLVVMLVVGLALGALQRAVPAMHVLSVGLAVRSLVGLAALSAALVATVYLVEAMCGLLERALPAAGAI